jgi:hypothetical protein
MTRDILAIAKNEAEIKRLFNQDRDITHYRRENLRVKTIETLMMIRMHTNKNEKNTTLFEKNISKNQLHFDQQNTTIYINAELNQNFESEIQLDDDEICVIENENDDVDFILRSEKDVSLQHKKRNKDNQSLDLKRKRVHN